METERRRRRVLAYVEDSTADARLLDEALARLHVINPVRHYESPQALLDDLKEPAERGKPDILLVDMSFRGPMQGLDLVREIRRQHPDMADTPIVIVTGSDTPTAKQLATLAGAEVFVGKPITFLNLLEAIRTVDPYALEIVLPDESRGD